MKASNLILILQAAQIQSNNKDVEITFWNADNVESRTFDRLHQPNGPNDLGGFLAGNKCPTREEYSFGLVPKDS